MEDIERDYKTGGAHVREDDPDELATVMCVFDAGLLEADAGEIRDRLTTGGCLVVEMSGWVIGASALDGDYTGAAAVSPSRRGRGVGAQLVRAALDHRGRFTIDFDGDAKSFYESLGFDIEDRNDGKGWFRGVLRDERRPRRHGC